MNKGRDMYFSADIEADGPAPGTSSMLSIGIVAYDPFTLESCGEFYRTLKRLPEARPNNDTMEWWDGFPKQWAEARANAEDPATAMKALHDWVVDMGKQAKRRHNTEKGPIPVFVAYPAGFDFSFVFYYLHRFVGESVFSFSALDLKSMVKGMLDVPFTSKQADWPSEWTSPLPHTHNALEDARHQGDQLVRMLKWRERHQLVSVQESADGKSRIITVPPAPVHGVVIGEPDGEG